MQRPGRLLAAALLSFSILDIFCATFKITAKTTRTLEIVSLPGGYMEVVQENTCSNAVIRLTCRSLRAFVFVLEAQYYRDESQFCEYKANKVKRVAQFREFRHKPRESLNTKVELRGNYIEDEKEENEDEQAVVDMRPWFNRR